MLKKVKSLLGHPLFAPALSLLSAALLLESLGAGLLTDDLLHGIMFRPEFRVPGGVRGDWDIFRFQGPDRGYLRHLMNLGILPWWTAPDFRCAFFRPLASLSHVFDYRVLSGRPSLMHAESLALYAGVTLAAARFYRRLIAPAWVAGLAALFFAVDEAHAMVVVWLANRNALIAALFGFWAILLHDRARRSGDRRAAALAPAAFAAALLGGEVATGTLAYVVAHALVFDEAPRRERLRALLPYALVVAAWLAAYKGLGYGAQGGDWYTDPISRPGDFAGAVLSRLPALLLAQFAGVPTLVWFFAPQERLWLAVAAAVVALSGLAFVLARVLGADRRAHFFSLGALLALLPACATWPQDRLLLFSGLGAFGLIALFFAKAAEVARGPIRAASFAVVGLFTLAHAVAAPILFVWGAHMYIKGSRARVDQADRALAKNTSDSVLIVVNSFHTMIATYVVAQRALRGEPMPRAVRELAHAVGDNRGELERLDDRTLAVTLDKGFLDGADILGRVFRGQSVPFQQGGVVAVDGMTAEIVALTQDARPKRVHFHFDRSLDDPSFQWVTVEKMRYVPTAPPPVGSKVQMSAIRF